MRTEGQTFVTRFEGLQWAVGITRGSRLNAKMTVSSGGLFDGWTYANGYVEHTYSQAFIDANEDWSIRLWGCCRIGTMRFNRNKYYTVVTKVNRDAFLSQGSGPSIDMFPLLEVTRGQTTQLTVSAFSSIDGLLSNGLMTLRWSTAAEMCGWSGSRCKNAEDYGVTALDSTTGLASWDTRLLQCGELTDPKCKTNRKFTGSCISSGSSKKRRLYHASTATMACPQTNVPTLQGCQNLCEQYKKCKFIRYNEADKSCYLLKNKGRGRWKSGWSSCKKNGNYRKPCLYPMQAIVTDSRGSSAAVDFLAKIVEPTLNKVCSIAGGSCGPPNYCDGQTGQCVQDPSPTFKTILSTQCVQQSVALVTCTVTEQEQLLLVVEGLDLNPNDRVTAGASNMPPGAKFSIDTDLSVNEVQHTLFWTPSIRVVSPGDTTKTFATRIQLSVDDEPSTYLVVEITVNQKVSAPTNITFASNLYGVSSSSSSSSTMMISSSIPSIDENAAPGKMIGYLMTQDPDPEDFGYHTYNLLNDASGRVALENTNGAGSSTSGIIISGANACDFETEDFFSFVVQSCDPSSYCIERTLTVVVKDINEPPTDIQLTSAVVSEHATANTEVGSLTAEDPDVVGQGSGQGTSATSSCEDNIEYNGPCITNKCPLNGISSIDSCKDLCDADSQCTALVYDGISNLCTLKYARGSALTVPSALEITSCTGARISGYGFNVFSIVSGSIVNPSYSPFYLKGNVLYTNGDLDHEQIASYPLTIRACSRGIGRGQSRSALITSTASVMTTTTTTTNDNCFFKDLAITIQDKNDSPTRIEFLAVSTGLVVPPHPAMNDGIPLVTLAENSAEDTVVAKLRTIDPDTTPQTFTYEILGASASGWPFKLSATTSDNTGTIDIVVNSTSILDYESNSNIFFVRIRSRDATLSAPVATLAVRLTNVVEPPIVVESSLEMTLSELSAPGTVAGNVKAEADQYGVHPLRFAVASSGGSASDILGIHSCSGNIYVLDNFAPVFPYDKVGTNNPVEYILNIEVTGESTVSKTVKVELTMRQRAPVWSNNGADVAVNLDESSTKDTSVIATLLDSGNQVFTLTIDATEIEESAGVVVTQATGATGTLKTGLTGVGMETVIVNAAAGVTFTDSAAVTVGSSTPILAGAITNVAVASVTIKDGVIDPNGDTPLFFSIVSGNKGGIFRISNTATGKIVVDRNAVLNFESISSYSLRIMVTDATSTATSSSSGMISYGVVKISIQDINDAPYVETGLTFEIDENSKGGTKVGEPIYYHDEEIAAGISQVVTFTVTDGNTGTVFGFDASIPGQLVVTGNANVPHASLDYESGKEYYILEVTATDNGTPAKAGSAMINVEVIDVNESPIFSDSISDFNEWTLTIDATEIEESAGVVVTQVGGATGTLKTALTGTDMVRVVIEAASGVVFTDLAALTIGSSTPVSAGAITEASSNPLFKVSEGAVEGTFIRNSTDGTSFVVASDVDQGTTLTYDFKSLRLGESDSFLIHRHTGGLQIKLGGGGLDYEFVNRYEILVRATDQGSLSAEKYIIIQINDENESPSLPDGIARIIEEGSAIGSKVQTFDSDASQATICGEDPDEGVAGELLFSITSTSSLPFEVLADGTTCFFLKVTSTAIDFETISSYTVAIRAVDKDAVAPLYVDTFVEITVIDINEAPVLTDAIILIRKRSTNDPAVGDVVSGRPLVAVDVDTTETALTYTIVSGNDNNHWSLVADAVNPMVAQVTLATANPSAGTEILQVNVKDSQNLVSVSTAAITITVVESNNPPDIKCYATGTNSNVGTDDDDACSFRVGEDATPGTVAATLGAVDVEGDSMTFSIVAGNDLGAFEIVQTTLALSTTQGADPQGGSTFAEIKLTATSNGILDYEASSNSGKSAFSLVVVCLDNNANPLYSGIVVNVVISDQNEAPEVEDVRGDGSYEYIKGEFGLHTNVKFDVSTVYGTETCIGETECQFRTVEAAEKFCTLISTCTSIFQHIQVVDTSTTRAYFCAGAKGCFSPRKGSVTMYDYDWAEKGGISLIKLDVSNTIGASVMEDALTHMPIVQLR